MNTTDYITEHYNKFNEDKRLKSRHGQIEYINTLRYIDRYLKRLSKDNSDIYLLDIGAGTGAYSGYFSNKGINVSAIELVKHNVSRLKINYPLVDAHQGNALKLKRYKDNTFDITLLFGPMYHLFENEEKICSLKEAVRVTKPGGYIFVAYMMNEYSIISYGFKEHHFIECLNGGRINKEYKSTNSPEDLYDFVRIKDIDLINKGAGVSRDIIFSPDGPANYMRQELREMDEEEFRKFVDYQYYNAERMDLIGAAAHTVDVIRVNE